MGTAADITNVGGRAGALVGATAGSVAGKIIGGIGVVGMGGAIGVSAAVLATGGAAVLAAMGYVAGDVAWSHLHAVQPSDLLLGGSAMAVGLALLVDGARQVLGDAAVQRGVAEVNATALKLYRTSAAVVARSVADLQAYRRSATVVGAGVLGGVGGAAAGSVYAASSVTVLGSHALGSAALGLGLSRRQSGPCSRVSPSPR